MRHRSAAAFLIITLFLAFSVPGTALANDLYGAYEAKHAAALHPPLLLLQDWDAGYSDEDDDDEEESYSDDEGDDSEDRFDGPKSKSSGKPPLNMFGIQPGIFHAIQDGQIRIDKLDIPGTPVDLGPDLGLDMAATVPIYQLFIQVEWEFGAIRLEPSWFSARYEGSERLDAGEPQMILDGWDFPVGTEWDATWDASFARLNLRFTPYIFRSGTFEFRPSLYGGSTYQRYYLRMRLTQNPGNIGESDQIKDEYSLVTGAVGTHLEFRFGSLWAFFYLTGLPFDRNELSTTNYEYGGGIKWEIFPMLIVSIEGMATRTRAERNDQFRIDQQVYGPAFYIILRI